jgi:hypothetical protein
MTFHHGHTGGAKIAEQLDKLPIFPEDGRHNPMVPNGSVRMAWTR